MNFRGEIDAMKKLIQLTLALLAFATTGVLASPSEDAANKLLDNFHSAASKAQFNEYFATFTPDGVFIGTDATERWTR